MQSLSPKTMRAARFRSKRCSHNAALPRFADLFPSPTRQPRRGLVMQKNHHCFCSISVIMGDMYRKKLYRDTATELLSLLTTTSSSQDSTARRARQLLDVLLAADAQLPFQEQLLAGGPWLVLYTQGSPQLWKAGWQAAKLVNPANAASQDLDPGSRAVINRAEYFGSKVYITASGTYVPMDDDPAMPKLIQANISSGLLHLLGVDIPLPIKGTGLFEVVYLDDRLRVFRSGSAVSVQVKQQYLADQGLL